MICELWPEEVAGKRFEAWCDNQGFCWAVISHKSPIASMDLLLKQLHKLQAKFSFDLRLEYVESKKNVAADALSRGTMRVFYESMGSIGYNRDDIAWFDVDVRASPRSCWSSEMVRRRRFVQSMRQEQSTVEMPAGCDGR